MTNLDEALRDMEQMKGMVGTLRAVTVSESNPVEPDDLSNWLWVMDDLLTSLEENLVALTAPSRKGG